MAIGVAAYERLPHQIGHVEAQAHAQRDERQPRIVALRLAHVAILAREVGERVGVLGEAQRVHIVHADLDVRDRLVDALDRLAEVLDADEDGHNDRQYDRCRAIQLVHGVVGEQLLLVAHLAEHVHKVPDHSSLLSYLNL